MGTTVVRHPAVAGRFYPKEQRKLLADIRSYLQPPAAPIPALGCIVPHAGYMYSGHVAGAVYAHLEIPERCIVLCPNHTGVGTPLSIMSAGAWEIPLGDVPIDQELATALIKQFPLLSEDSSAHLAEHAIEVQLPFLRTKQKNLRFVPVAIGTREFDTLEALGQAIAEVVGRQQERVLVLASSDMNHYESDAITRIKDAKAIAPVLNRNARELYDIVRREKISMCGYGPAVAMIVAANRLGRQW